MVSRINTVAFQGIEALDVDVQVQMASGLPAFTVVGLPDNAVKESRERVRAALGSIGLALPPKRITVNLAPANVIKEGSHFDLPIALGLLTAMEVLPFEELMDFVVLGELGLDGAMTAVPGALVAAMHANRQDRGLICPLGNGTEAAWSGNDSIIASHNLLALVNHFKGNQMLPLTDCDYDSLTQPVRYGDLKEVKGQETAKRALEVAAAGRHHLLMTGPPGSGKSLLAARLPGLLPPLTPEEALEVSMIHSVAGELQGDGLVRQRPFRSPHHNASMAAMVGGSIKAKPGELSLAHMGVLFLDELPEFNRNVLESLRQPLETGKVSIARANAHVTYPARIQLVAAMNPCKCGHMGDPDLQCNRVPHCGKDYQSKISGPLLDRFDMHVDVPAVSALDLTLPPPSEGSAEVATRVAQARAIQAERYQGTDAKTNGDCDGELLEQVASPDAKGRDLLLTAITDMKLSARGYHRILKVARTLADLDGTDAVGRTHIAEALSYRRLSFKR